MSILERNMKRYTVTLADMAKETTPTVELSSMEDIEREQSFVDRVKDFDPSSPLDMNSLDVIEKEIEQDPDLLFDAFDKDDKLVLNDGPKDNSNIETQVSELKMEETKQQTQGVSLNTKVKNADKLRRNLMSRLTYEKIWLTPQEKPKFYETAIIFDWDDTLLCTSFINPSGVY
jgi:hypothetical protein